MKSKNIKYHFEFEDGGEELFDLTMDLEKQQILNVVPEKLPEWTKLDVNKCENCPLKSAEQPHCPLASSIVILVNKFDNILSYNRVKLTVTLDKKQIIQETDAQTAVSSLMGLLIATSNCPHTEFLKPMAHFHFPLATEEETLFRSTGAFLLSQYFKMQKGTVDKIDVKELATYYKELNVVNYGISLRIRAASKADSTVNAIVMLDVFALIFPEVIEDSLKDIKYIFDN